VAFRVHTVDPRGIRSGPQLRTALTEKRRWPRTATTSDTSWLITGAPGIARQR